MTHDDRRTMKNWAARLSAPDEPLTLAEAQLLASIAATDRLLELRDTLGDLKARVQRLELFVAATVPGYDAGTQALARKMLVEADRG